MISANVKRRLRTYSRRLRASAGPGLSHNCFFMHVPKCGGTSISEALYATVPIHKRVGVVDANATRRATAIVHVDHDELFLYHDDLPTGEAVYALREGMLLTHMAWDTALIHGHILFSEKADHHFGDRYKYVTVLREPVARLVSNYNGSVSHGLTTTDFATYLESETARTHALSALRYFTGRHFIAPGTEDSAVKEALEVAEKFAVIGFLDQLNAFCAAYCEVFGAMPQIFRYNEAQGSPYHPTPTELARARELLAPEIVFWERIRERRAAAS